MYTFFWWGGQLFSGLTLYLCQPLWYKRNKAQESMQNGVFWYDFLQQQFFLLPLFRKLYVNVRWFRKDFRYPWILSKNKKTNSFLLLRRIRLFVIWENSRTPKSPFKIIWPLDILHSIVNILRYVFTKYFKNCQSLTE